MAQRRFVVGRVGARCTRCGLRFCLPLSGIEPATPSTIDFGAMFPFACIPACNPPCLRFAAAVTGRHARLGTRLLARLCRGRHCRRLSRTRLQGTTRTGPSKASRFLPRVSTGKAYLRLAVRGRAPVTRVPGTVSGACFARPRSPWSPPLAPPTPQRASPPCWPASRLLCRSVTSDGRALLATAPDLPKTDQSRNAGAWAAGRP
jgi:hypothetical protein